MALARSIWQVAAGWNIDTQIREEVGFTDGRIYVRGKVYKRGKQKRADYILYYKPEQYFADLALYQGLSDNDADTDAYKQFSPSFFDLVIVDECHRGSARDNSRWREILDFHALRHTFATMLACAGVSPRVAMELMRHSDRRL